MVKVVRSKLVTLEFPEEFLAPHSLNFPSRVWYFMNFRPCSCILMHVHAILQPHLSKHSLDMDKLKYAHTVYFKGCFVTLSHLSYYFTSSYYQFLPLKPLQYPKTHTGNIPGHHHPKALDIHVSSHESPVPAAQWIQHCSSLLGLDEQRAPNVPHAERNCTRDRSLHRAQTTFRQSIPWKIRSECWKKVKNHGGKHQITSNIQWDHAWFEKKTWALAALEEIFQRIRPKDLICRNDCKKDIPCKYTKAPNISNYHQTTFGRYVCHKSYQRYKPNQGRSFTSTQSKRPKMTKRSKKSNPKHLTKRNFAWLICNSCLSRHGLPVFDQHPPTLQDSARPTRPSWCQESLSAESEVDL